MTNESKCPCRWYRKEDGIFLFTHRSKTKHYPGETRKFLEILMKFNKTFTSIKVFPQKSSWGLSQGKWEALNVKGKILHLWFEEVILGSTFGAPGANPAQEKQCWVCFGSDGSNVPLTTRNSSLVAFSCFPPCSDSCPGGVAAGKKNAISEE